MFFFLLIVFDAVFGAVFHRDSNYGGSAQIEPPPYEGPKNITFKNAGDAEVLSMSTPAARIFCPIDSARAVHRKTAIEKNYTSSGATFSVF